MAMFSEDAIQRSTSAPPAQSSHLLFDQWGPLALQPVPTPLNPRFPRDHDVHGSEDIPRHGSTSTLAQPRPARHPGAIGTPVPSPQPQPQPQPQPEAPFIERPKSVMDLIQEDFPRTPSPVFQASQLQKVGRPGGLPPHVSGLDGHDPYSRSHSRSPPPPQRQVHQSPNPQAHHHHLPPQHRHHQAVHGQHGIPRAANTFPTGEFSAPHHQLHPDAPHAPPGDFPTQHQHYPQHQPSQYVQHHLQNRPPPSALPQQLHHHAEGALAPSLDHVTDAFGGMGLDGRAGGEGGSKSYPHPADRPEHDASLSGALPAGALPVRTMVYPMDGIPPNSAAYYAPPQAMDPRAMYRIPTGFAPREMYYSANPRMPAAEYVAVVPLPPGHGQFYHELHHRDTASGRVVFYPADSPAFPHHPGARGFRDDGLPNGDKTRSRGMRRGDDKSRDSSRGKKGGKAHTLLEEFRASAKGRHWELGELTGNIVQFCQDQHGSRFIQQRLEVASLPDKNLIFNEILPHAHELMVDVFGNYVVQKMLEHGAPEHRDLLLALLRGRAVQLALQMYGCRVIQKALEVLDTQQLLPLVQEFKWQVMNCVHDQNGNHVIQKCIEVLCTKTSADGQPGPESEIEFIISAFRGHVQQLSTHPYGCRVIQRILEHCADEQKFVVLDEILVGIPGLIQDQYGNYVVQHVIQFGRPADRLTVVDEVRQHLLPFAQHKFASNVVEKCLQYGTPDQKNAIVDDICHPPDNRSTLLVMIKDQYANYVIQKVIDLAEKRQLNDIVEQLRTHAVVVKRCTYGKHILTRVEKATGIKI